jgi:FMN reductase
MLRLTNRVNPSALVLSASAGVASRASVLAGCALVSAGDEHMTAQRVELSRISPVALYDGVPSDRLDNALAAVDVADVLVVVAPVEGAAYGGLLPAFLDRLAPGALEGKVVVPLLLGGDPAALARFEASLRRRLENAGAVVALGEVFDASDDFSGVGGDARIDARVARAVSEGVIALRARFVPDLVGALVAPLEESQAGGRGSDRDGCVVQTVGLPALMAG